MRSACCLRSRSRCDSSIMTSSTTSVLTYTMPFEEHLGSEGPACASQNIHMGR